MKQILCMVLPLAALIGSWIGFAAGGGLASEADSLLLLLFAFCFLIGFWAYFASERSRLNRAREYR